MPSLWAALYPAQMAKKAPRALKRIEEIEKKLPPQRAGIYPPTIDPTKSPVIMSVFCIVLISGNILA
jgi:hypothetical protein